MIYLFFEMIIHSYNIQKLLKNDSFSHAMYLKFSSYQE